MPPLDLALVGAAHIHTPNFIRRILTRSDVRVKYVWDHDFGRAQRRAAELDAVAVGELAPIWQDELIKGVIICSETNRHEPLVMEAVAARKHLFVEKPLGMGHDDAARAWPTPLRPLA